ncbi:hypothetical protein D1B33_05365 [Lysinibacillus yapensis]|uniref:Glutamate dehydrogenase n=1 Tax=Ureibacillus yapensis TaxID=2304605 RepID=A0A396SHW9_9BACL|nr:Glu/Leu/Phe/Val dehydrogenase dimerization domain-containing protein [Lysinibacillus yapensis]RHW38315.1 hypothetical protein D1B33_05365 [Lysinibacillus yapensis]
MNSFLVTEWTDTVTGAKGYLALDRVFDGVAGGGIRMKEGVSKEEVQRLAHTMTLKLMGLGMPIGGAKAGIDYPSNKADSKDVLYRFLEAHKPFLEQVWGASEDLGTTKEDIVRIVTQLGLESPVDAFLYRMDSSTKEVILNNLKESLSLNVDGVTITDLVTGLGVANSTLEALKSISLNPEEATVSIQGFGSVGASTAKYLNNAKVKIVSVSDVSGTLYNPEGLDVELLLKAKDEKGNINRSLIPENYIQSNRSDWLTYEVDVLIPAAIADAINDENESQIQAKLIVEGANIPVTIEAEKQLFDRGILVVPDFIANSAGAGFFGTILYKGIGPDAYKIFDYLSNQVSSTTEWILRKAKEENISPREAAVLFLDTNQVKINVAENV